MLDGLLLIAQEAQSAAAGSGGTRLWAYAAFIALMLAFLALDLGVFHREAHAVSMREAVTWSVIWVTCGIAFSGFVYMTYEHQWLGLGFETAR